MRTLSRKEVAVQIRAKLKAMGVKANVRGRRCGYSDAIDITVKELRPLKPIEKLAGEYEDISRDGAGDILMGANTYVGVKFADGIQLPADWLADIKKAINGIGFGPGFTPITAKLHHWRRILSDLRPGYDPDTCGKIIYMATYQDEAIRSAVTQEEGTK
jgi:hypothetical protein